MKISYDPKADAMYIRFLNKKSSKSVEVGGDIIADYSGKSLVGIEILDASEKLPKDKLSTSPKTFNFAI